MITVKILSDKNVKVNYYTNEDGSMDFWITYKCATKKDPGVHTSESKELKYEVSAIRRYHSKTNSSTVVNYAKYLACIKTDVTSFSKLQEDLNREYFKLKKYSMIDARQAKIDKLKIAGSKKHARKIENLQEEISILRQIEDGKPFGAYILTKKYREQEENMLKMQFLSI